MLQAVSKARMRRVRIRRWASVVVVVALLSTTLGACGGSSGSGSAGGSKLIVATMGFPCTLNDFAKSLCAGFRSGAQSLPKGFRFELKTGTDYADQTGYNNLIQTSAQLNPGGMIIFPGGPSAQVPVLKQACARKIKLIVVDNPIVGLGSCQDSYIAASHRRLGEDVGHWLVAHPSASREVGIVTFPPGQASSMDDRSNGFRQIVEAAGFKVVAVVTTDLTLEKTRTQVTNMLTAHPKLGAILSANDQIGYGTAQAVAHSGNKKVMQLTIDGALDAARRIVAGSLAADAAQNPYFAGKQSVLRMAKLLQGGSIPATVNESTKVVDATNAKQFIAAGGLH